MVLILLPLEYVVVGLGSSFLAHNLLISFWKTGDWPLGMFVHKDCAQCVRLENKT